MTERDEDVQARLLMALGNVALSLAVVVGKPLAGSAVRAVLHSAADAIRLRGVPAREIVEKLEHLDGPSMPWDRTPPRSEE